MEMVIPVSASYVLSRPKRDPLKGLLWFAVLVPVVSLLLTGSRGGFVSVLVEMAILGWIMIWRNPLPGRRKRVAATGLALVAVAALFFWLVPTFVLTKLGTINNYVPEASEGSRLALWRNSLGIFRDHPWVGAGMGSFVTVYPPYQTEASDLVTEHAHNDYVEALTETGLLGGVLILAALVLFIPITFRNLAVQLKYEAGLDSTGRSDCLLRFTHPQLCRLQPSYPRQRGMVRILCWSGEPFWPHDPEPGGMTRAGKFQSPFQSQ